MIVCNNFKIFCFVHYSLCYMVFNTLIFFILVPTMKAVQCIIIKKWYALLSNLLPRAFGFMTNKMVHQKKPGVNTRDKILMLFNIIYMQNTW